MSAISDLIAFEETSRKRGGPSILAALAWVVQNAYGVDLRGVTPAPLSGNDAATIEELREHMTKLLEAVALLQKEAEEQRTQLASVTAYVEGVPNLVAVAVADALAKFPAVDTDAAAAAIDAARQTISDSTDAALAAIQRNTAPLTEQPASAGPETTDLEQPSPAPDAAPPSDPSPDNVTEGVGDTTQPAENTGG